MTRPVYKIETYTGAVLDHTITSDAINIRVKETLTENVGTFSFTVPTKKNGDTYYYNDIAVNDKIKIYLGYDSISASDLVTIGKVYQIAGPLSTESGYLRAITGRNQGEILKRRLKGMKEWVNVDASVFVTELANDLSLGTGEIATDTTDVNFTVDIDKHETYLSLLQKVSDYWYNAGTQIKKDFYVDTDNNLVWKSRPIRTSGVETLTVGDNIIAYQVFRDLDCVRNKIWVYGAAELATPTDKDSWTEDLTKPNNQLDHADGTWTCFSGAATISIDTANEIVGSNCVKTAGGAATGLVFDFDNGKEPNANYYPSFTSQVYVATGHEQVCIRFTDDSGDDNEAIKWFTAKPNEWSIITSKCGSKNADLWSYPKANVSVFDWSGIKKIEWITSTTAGVDFYVDGAFFNSRRFLNTAEDATSQSNYGVREMVVVDDALGSTAECEMRGEALLYQLKDPPIRLDVTVPGNTGLKIGDRLPMTIPAENISAVNFDVITVIHTFNKNQGFRTNATMLDSGSLRYAPPISMNEVLVDQFKRQKETAKGIQRVN